jgi:glyoxylase-like metal-dependent hydrolase (beta-lactamase superfamily II)
LCWRVAIRIGFEDRGLLFTGDALVTADTAIGRAGPRLLCRAYTQDSQRALHSLEFLAHERAELVLPGHGDPWTGDPAEAAHLAWLAGTV